MARKGADIRWTGHKELSANIPKYGQRVQWAVYQLGLMYAAKFETYAKENAPWTDRTANARQGLHSWVEVQDNGTVRVFLSHSMEYGVHLETRGGGRWAIIFPTIEAHLDEIQKNVRDLFKGRSAR